MRRRCESPVGQCIQERVEMHPVYFETRWSLFAIRINLVPPFVRPDSTVIYLLAVKTGSWTDRVARQVKADYCSRRKSSNAIINVARRYASFLL